MRPRRGWGVVGHDDVEDHAVEGAVFFPLGERVDAVRGNRGGLILTGEPQVAALAEGRLTANFWLRCGDAAGVDHAAGFVRRTRVGLPARLRGALGRVDGGFCSRWAGRTTRPARDGHRRRAGAGIRRGAAR